MIRLSMTTTAANGAQSIIRLDDAFVLLLALSISDYQTTIAALTPAQAHRLADELRAWASIYEPRKEQEQQS